MEIYSYQEEKSMYPGIDTRLEKEMMQFTPLTMKIKLIDES